MKLGISALLERYWDSRFSRLLATIISMYLSLVNCCLDAYQFLLACEGLGVYYPKDVLVIMLSLMWGSFSLLLFDMLPVHKSPYASNTFACPLYS